MWIGGKAKAIACLRANDGDALGHRLPSWKRQSTAPSLLMCLVSFLGENLDGGAYGVASLLGGVILEAQASCRFMVPSPLPQVLPVPPLSWDRSPHLSWNTGYHLGSGGGCRQLISGSFFFCAYLHV